MKNSWLWICMAATLLYAGSSDELSFIDEEDGMDEEFFLEFPDHKDEISSTPKSGKRTEELLPWLRKGVEMDEPAFESHFEESMIGEDRDLTDAVLEELQEEYRPDFEPLPPKNARRAPTRVAEKRAAQVVLPEKGMNEGRKIGENVRRRAEHSSPKNTKKKASTQHSSPTSKTAREGSLRAKKTGQSENRERKNPDQRVPRISNKPEDSR